METVSSILKSHTVADLPCMASSSCPITVLYKDSVESTRALLQEKSFLSLPVAHPSRGYLGFVDVLDLLCAGVEAEKSASKSTRKVEDIVTGGWHAVESGASLFTLVRSMVTSSRRRVPVVDGGGELVAIVSATDVVRYVVEEVLPACAKLAQLPVSQVGTWGSPRVVDASSPVCGAFVSLHHSNVSALGVVDADGRLVGNLSASDLQGRLSAVAGTVAEFLGASAGVIGLNRGATLRQAAELMNQKRIHRVWITDEETGAPVAVISQVDVLKKVFQEC